MGICRRTEAGLAAAPRDSHYRPSADERHTAGRKGRVSRGFADFGGFRPCVFRPAASPRPG